MQLIFSIDEFMTLVHILRESETDAQLKRSLRDSAEPILQKLLNREFGFAIDELEDMEEILREYSGKLKQEAEVTSPRGEQTSLVRQKVLDRIMDKVSEACAMV